MSTRRPSGLGDFEKLPPEIRTEIFKRLLPADFHQTYHIFESKLIYSPQNSSPEPPCFGASKQLRSEMLAALNVNSEYNLTIGLREITTDFIASRSSSNNTTPVFDANQVTACQMLNIIILRPSPRSATAFAQLRNNVHNLVERLNIESKREVLPKLTVRLESSYAVDAYSDFSILMGPFYLLAKSSRAILIYRTTGSTTFCPAIEKQCNLLESSLNGGAMERSILRYQQCNLEIKLALLLKFWDNETSINGQERIWLQIKSNERVSGACNGLRLWYEENGITLPDWLPEVEHLAANGRLLTASDAFLKQIFCQGSGSDMFEQPLRSWVSGHHRTTNPFWDDVVGDAIADVQKSGQIQVHPKTAGSGLLGWE